MLRPTRRWSGSSIGSIAMGQEVGVTPIQLVTMVSTIANGGIYLPPHILMQEGDADARQASRGCHFILSENCPTRCLPARTA